jgi:hypothetical protein
MTTIPCRQCPVTTACVYSGRCATAEMPKSPTLKRLIEEVRVEKGATGKGGYNRTHNRHNRS